MAPSFLVVASSVAMSTSAWPLKHSTSGALKEENPTNQNDWDRLPVMVLNLDKRTDRMKRLASTLTDPSGPTAPFSLEQVCRVPAVNTAAVGDAMMRTGVIERNAWQRAVNVSLHHNQESSLELSKGSVGCLLTHALAWKRIVDLNLPVAMILEDDTSVLSAVMRKRFASFSRDLPAEWKLVQMNSCFSWNGTREWWWGSPTGPEAGMHATNRMVDVDLNSCGTDMNRDCPKCMGAYLMSLEGAKHMLKASFPMTVQLDSSPAFNGMPDHYYSDPPLALQFRDDDSDDQVYPSSFDDISKFRRQREHEVANLPGSSDVSERGGIANCAELPSLTSSSEFLTQAFSSYV